VHRGDALGVAPAGVGATLDFVPTARPRHFVTETDALAEALDEAARRWPGLSRAQLLVRLALEGHCAAKRSREERRRRRLEAVRTYSGCVTGVYGSDYLQRLREDWPA
jgi:hypothetical protein